ncbi:MAG TPA: hypothetical protein VGK67_25770 [Myxococcales bacterium]|jgi:hypothetical protein
MILLPSAAIAEYSREGGDAVGVRLDQFVPSHFQVSERYTEE